jgi:Domain of unknown function DUF11/PASTA domain
VSRVRRCIVWSLLATVATLTTSASAQALTLGSTTVPVGATGETCTGSVLNILQTSVDASYLYAVPAGGGIITSWSFNTSGATAGTPYTLIVAQPSGSGYTVVGTDTEVVPASAPAVQTYSLAKPISVSAGDLIGVGVSASSDVVCYWRGGSLTSSDLLTAVSGSLTSGSSLANVGPGPPASAVNVSVNLVQSEDVGLTQQALPNSIVAGGQGVLLLSVTNAGPGSTPITVADSVASGLTIDSVNAGASTCATSGQNISCVLPSAPATIAVVVTAATAGTYTSIATALTTLADPNQANNTSSATLDVSAVRMCRLISLAHLRVAQAKAVISALGCAVGKVTSKASKSVPKGEVISISPGARKVVALGTKVAIVTSSGRPKTKKKKPKR